MCVQVIATFSGYGYTKAPLNKSILNLLSVWYNTSIGHQCGKTENAIIQKVKAKKICQFPSLFFKDLLYLTSSNFLISRT